MFFFTDGGECRYDTQLQKKKKREEGCKRVRACLVLRTQIGVAADRDNCGMADERDGRKDLGSFHSTIGSDMKDTSDV